MHEPELIGDSEHMTGELLKQEYVSQQLAFYRQDNLSPLDIQPVDINEYPMAIEYCERRVSAVKKSISAIKRLVTAIEDDKAREVNMETEQVPSGKGFKTKKKYTNAEDREREIRFRCQLKHEHYATYLRRLIELEAELGEWNARFNKLRRELRLLEHSFVTTGERVFMQHTGRTFDTGGEDI